MYALVPKRLPMDVLFAKKLFPFAAIIRSIVKTKNARCHFAQILRKN